MFKKQSNGQHLDFDEVIFDDLVYSDLDYLEMPTSRQAFLLIAVGALVSIGLIFGRHSRDEHLEPAPLPLLALHMHRAVMGF